MAILSLFEDDSSAYLSHYGVKGMKWGVWNEETKARRLGFNPTEAGEGGGGGILLDEQNEEEEKENPDYWLKKDSEWSQNEDMAVINPYYDKGLVDIKKIPDDNAISRFDLSGVEDYGYAGYTVNCATCSVVYDLRRRGYDVDANGTTNMAPQVTKTISDYYLGATVNEDTYSEDFEKAVKALPDGARGIISGTTVHGGGHTVAWSRENGMIVYRDCQTNKKYYGIRQLYDTNVRSETTDKGLAATKDHIWWTRLDDKTPVLKRMREDGIVSKRTKSGNVSNLEEDRLRSIKGYTNISKRKINRNARDTNVTDEKQRKELEIQTKADILNAENREARRIAKKKEKL